MLVKTDEAVENTSAQKRVFAGALFVICVAVTAVTLSGPLLELVRRWDWQEEYRHGYIIPLIAIWLLWTRRDALAKSVGRPSLLGPAAIVVAALMHIVGKLSALFILSQLSFIVILIGLVLAFGGFSLLRVAFVPIAFLIFAIPLPYFIDAALSFRLQIISSQLGVFFIRLMNIPVYLEGNVIDLGNYQLQVVEACSGLRYLYPLASLGFLAAYLFQAPFWQRALIFVSTVPITILMNSLRIALVGILGTYWGPQDADGFLHLFEGWIIFIGCTLFLIAETALLARFVLRKPFFDVFYPSSGSAVIPRDGANGRLAQASLAICLLAVCSTALLAHVVTTRQEIIPERKLFAAFPHKMGEWTGRTSSLGAQTEYGLGLTDYVLSDYARPDGRQVNLYVAYYASQRMGVSPHSPSVCIPGNGWSITDLTRTSFRSDDSRISLPLNRAIVARRSERLLAYYWYEQRGMKIANEYWSKLYLLRDAIFKNRTDGALVRLMTPIYPGESEREAEKRLQSFVEAVVPQLSAFLPSNSPVKVGKL